MCSMKCYRPKKIDQNRNTSRSREKTKATQITVAIFKMLLRDKIRLEGSFAKMTNIRIRFSVIFE